MYDGTPILSPQEERLSQKTVPHPGRDRIFGILDRFLHSVPNIDIERARYFTRSMKETEGQHLSLRWAKALYACAEGMTVYITPGQLVAGRAGKSGRYGILYPEIDGDFYQTVLENVAERNVSPFRISDEDRRILLEEVAPYWQGKTFHEHLNKALPQDLRAVTYDDDEGLYSKFVVSETASYRSALQWVHDYEKVLSHGFVGIRKTIQDRLDRLDPLNPIETWEKKPVLEAMLIVCDAIVLWARRHAALARDMAAAEPDPSRRRELLQIAEICERVPEHPARTFREAVQSQWFVQLFSRLEQKASAVISNGRMDQYFFPYYRRDIDAGLLTDEQAMELLECVWVEMAQFIDLYINPTGNAFNEGYAHWEAVTIGGQTPDGRDATNDLSFLFLRSKRELPLNYPDLAARIHTRSDTRFLYEVAETIKDGSGFPKLINDEEVIPLYVAKGAPLREALDYSVSGCTEARLPNRDTYTSGCVYINLATAIEFTLRNGRLLKYGEQVIGLETGEPQAFDTWDAFYTAYKGQHLNLLRKGFAQQVVVDALRPQHFATPFASALHDLCVAEAKDLQSPKIEGGIDFGYFEILGYGTVVDSLAAIRKIVFEERKATLAEVIAALNDDFQGHAPLRARLQAAPRYGNNDNYADDIARDLDRLSQEAARTVSEVRGIHIDVRYVPITSHVPFGKVVSATPNGRKAWAPLSDGSSASHGADENGPTAVLLSNFNSKNHDLIGRASRLLNIKLSPGAVAGDSGTEKIVTLIRTWVDLRLWHLQFNIINRHTLIAAQNDPDAYRGLLVRIAGYSAYFCDLSKELQNDIIERTEHGVV